MTQAVAKTVGVQARQAAVPTFIAPLADRDTASCKPGLGSVWPPAHVPAAREMERRSRLLSASFSPMGEFAMTTRFDPAVGLSTIVEFAAEARN